MYSEQSGQDFGGGRSDRDRIYNATAAYGAWREESEAGTLSQRDYKSTNHIVITDGGGQPDCSAFRKSRRAKSMTDDETWVDGDHANTLNRFDVGDTRTTHIVVEAHGVSKDDDAVAGTLCANAQGGRQRMTDIAAAYVAETFSVYPEGGNGADIAAAKVERSPALTKVRSERGVHVTQAFTQNQREEVRDLGDQSGALTGQGTHQQTYLREQMTVRRLTPVECERLMGLPDGWTAPEGVKAPDSKRYAACGDAIVTTVAFWIADRIRMIEEEEAS
jgi:site-specific DNA-cytosine methylase